MGIITMKELNIFEWSISHNDSGSTELHWSKYNGPQFTGFMNSPQSTIKSPQSNDHDGLTSNKHDITSNDHGPLTSIPHYKPILYVIIRVCLTGLVLNEWLTNESGPWYDTSDKASGKRNTSRTKMRKWWGENMQEQRRNILTRSLRIT